jgi:hypothetical protein
LCQQVRSIFRKAHVVNDMRHCPHPTIIKSILVWVACARPA